ncbi:MAG TPA: hypothetical protein VGB26_06495 [Nitrospiria bacterium]|jgi:hypothetical protein
MRVFGVCLGIFLLVGCMGPSRIPPGTDEGIEINLSYQMAFQELKSMLQTRGYTVSIADERVGIIETLPKLMAENPGSIQHKVLLSFLLRGDSTRTTVYMRFIVTSDVPEERKKFKEMLKGLSP